MKKLLLFLFLIAAFCLPPLASSQITPRKEQQNPQTLYKDQANTYSGGGRQDFGNVIVALPGSTTPPATCAARDVYIDTDAAVGSRFLLCIATNTWAAIDNPFGLTIDDSEIPAGIARDSEITLPNLAGGASGANDYDYGGATALRLKVGSGAPAGGDCDAAGEVGRIYARTDANGTNATLYVCSKTSAAPTYAWELTQGAGGGGSMTFLGLTDAPDSYAGQANKLVTVKADETAVEFTDPFVSGPTAHDAVGTSTNPVLTGGYASAAAPADVSADGDAVRGWHLRNGAAATVITAGGALIGGDAANGLDVDVTRLPALVAGSALIGKVGIDQTTPGTTNRVDIGAALPAGTNVIGHAIIDTGSTTAVTQGTASNLKAQVQGEAASGASKAGNPVQIGGVFNTTQPTVTTGQAVEAQSTARGAMIVAPGVDSFAVQNTQQGTASQNVAQFGGTNVVTGTGAGGSGIPRVTISNDSSLAANQSVNTAQFGGTNVVTGTGAGGAGIPRVTISNDSSLAANQSVNVAQVAGNTTSTAASGTQKVGIVGNTAAAVDSTIGAGTAPANQIVTGDVYNTTAPAPTAGQAMALQADQSGNLRTFPGMGIATLSGWTSGTSVNATQNIFTNSGASAVLVQLTQTTTISAGAINFEVSFDNSNWVTVTANQVLDPTSATLAQISLPYTLQASTNKKFLILPQGAQGLRIKLTTAITGSATVTPNYALLNDPVAPQVIALSPTAANFNVTNTQSGTASQNVAQFGGTNVATGTGAGGAGIPRVTISNDSSLAANQSVNAAQFGGTNVVTGTGAGGAGIPRVTISNDSSLAANQSVNVAQINAVTPLMGNGATGTGSPRVTIANDNSALTVRAGNSNAIISCTANAKLNMTTATTTQIVALSGATVIYVCSYSIITSAATNVKFVSGT
jgi:hypothetical protein